LFGPTFSVYRTVVLPAAPRPSITHLRHCFFGPPNHDTGCCKEEEEEDMSAAPILMNNMNEDLIFTSRMRSHCGGYAVLLVVVPHVWRCQFPNNPRSRLPVRTYPGSYLCNFLDIGSKLSDMLGCKHTLLDCSSLFTATSTFSSWFFYNVSRPPLPLIHRQNNLLCQPI
jgi:hypothetical protein